MHVIAQAPCRVSIIGGGADLPEYLQHRETSRVLSTAIDRWVAVRGLTTRRPATSVVSARHMEVSSRLPEICQKTLEHYNLRNVRLHIASDVPPGSGLGSSGALGVALSLVCHRFLEEVDMMRYELAAEAYHLERNVWGYRVGYQDASISALGGFRLLTFNKDGLLSGSDVYHQDVQDVLLLFRLQETHHADDILEVMARDYAMGKHSLEVADEIQTLVQPALEASSRRKWDELGRILQTSWELKRQLSKNISNEKIERCIRAALNAGAYGCKVTGAGAGGHLLVCSEIDAQSSIRSALAGQGCIDVPFEFERRRAKIIYYADEI